MDSSGELGSRGDGLSGHALDLVATLPGVVWEADATTQRMRYVSPQAVEMLGHDPDRWVEEPGFWEEHLHPNDLAAASLALERAIATGGPARIEYRYRCADGTYRWVQDVIRVTRDPTGSTRLTGLMVDVTDTHDATDELAVARSTGTNGGGPGGVLSSPLHKMVADSVSDGVFYTDGDRRITYWNHGAARLAGYPADATLGRRCDEDLMCCVDAEGSSLCGTCPLATALERGWERQQVLWMRHATGQRVAVTAHTYPIRDQAGRPSGAVETFADARVLAEAVPGSAPGGDPFVDAATGLPDRRLIGAVLTVRKDELDRHWLPFGLVVVEVDRLDELAAELGPAASAQVLRAVGGTLRATLRAGDVIVRWGPAQFAIAVSMTGASGIETLGDRLLRLVRATAVPTASGPVTTTISLGASVAVRWEPLEQLYVRAEHALGRAKRLGRDRLVLVDAVLPTPGVRTLGARGQASGVLPR